MAAYVPRREALAVGALGVVTLERGWYAYVGSARRGRAARVARHLRTDKPLRWHADYLFARHAASLAWLIDGASTGLPRPAECDLAAGLLAASRGPAGRCAGSAPPTAAAPAICSGFPATRPSAWPSAAPSAQVWSSGPSASARWTSLLGGPD